MKKKWHLYIGLVVGICIAASISLLYLPFWIGKGSFVMGFMAGLAFLTSVLMAILIWNRESLLNHKPAADNPTSEVENNTRSLSRRQIIFTTLLIAVGTLISLFIYNNQALRKQKWQDQQIQIEQQAELIESNRISGLTNLMNMLLQRMDEELAASPDRSLSDETIGRIAALSYSFIAYKQLKGDSLSVNRLSPERGQLLMMISRMDMDSTSLNKILVQTSFAGAFLEDADLQEANLKNVDLKNAGLKDIQLQGANLEEANMQAAMLWGANLSKARLNGVILKTADMKWTILNEVELKAADLRGADLSSAQLRKADMSGADMQYIDLNGSILEEAIMTGAKMNSANLKKAQLNKSTIREANMTSAHLNEAILTGADLTGATLSLANMTGADLTDAILMNVLVTDKNWLTRLEEWGVKGAKEIQSKYKIVDHSTAQKTQYRLELKNK